MKDRRFTAESYQDRTPFVIFIPFLFVLQLPDGRVWFPGLQRLHNVPFVYLFAWFF